MNKQIDPVQQLVPTELAAQIAQTLRHTRIRMPANALEALACAHSVNELLDVMVPLLRRLCGVDVVFIRFREDAYCHFHLHDSGAALPKAVLESFSALALRSIRERRQLTQARLGPDYFVSGAGRFASGMIHYSLAATPTPRQAPTAVVGVGWFDARTPGADDLALLEALAQVTGHALRRLAQPRPPLGSDQSFRNIVEMSLDGVLVLVAGNVVYANQAMYDMLRISDPSQLIGHKILEFIASRFHDHVRMRISSADAGYTNPPLELCLNRADGSSVDAEVSSGPACWEQQDATQVLVKSVASRKRVVDALRESEERFRALVESCAQAIWETDPSGIAVTDSPSWRAYTGETIDEFPGHGWLDAVHPDDREYARRVWRATVASGKPFSADFRLRQIQPGSNGAIRWRWTQVHAAPLRNEDGSIRKWVGMNIDITEQKENEEALRITTERLQLAIEATGDGIWDLDLKSHAAHYSARLKNILGYTDDELSSDHFEMATRIHPDDWPRVMAQMRDCISGKVPTYVCEFRVMTKNDHWKWVLSRGVVVKRDPDGSARRMAGMLTDISERKQAEQMVWQVANYDVLTGLPNRRLFRDRLEQEVHKARRHEHGIALMFIDLDRFKQINDLLGHDAGDQLLIEVARRICRCVRTEDTVARLGGDEFTVIVTGLQQTSHVEQLAQKILDALAAPIQIGKEVAYISGSVGLTFYPQDATSPEELIRKADQAMYAAKHAGKNQFSYYTQSMDRHAHQRLRMTAELRNALQLHQLQVYFQPVVELTTGKIFKAEALLRWQHPTLGAVPPSLFVPLAEESGLINEIGDWVFHEAAHWAKRWSEQLGKPFRVGINKSPLQFLSNKQNGWVGYLHRLGLPPQNITVEITEGLLLDASSNVSRKLFEYRDAGIQLAIDDFGTGYSSMAYLKKFDVDFLKIDQSFVREMESDNASRTIAESIIAMGHKLGLKVIAEGIETVRQREMLTAAECDYGQGFLFSRPLDAAQFEALLLR